MADWIDVSVSLTAGMAHWPDNPPVLIERTQDLCRGDVATVSAPFGAHRNSTWTRRALHRRRHHDRRDAVRGDTAGPARVIQIKDREAIKVKEIERYAIRRGERLLFKTHNSPHA